MIQKERTIPNQSILKNQERSFDYVDSYQGWFIAKVDNTNLKEFVKLFISSGPEWANTLMIVRDKIVGLFGLKTSSDIAEQDNQDIKLEVGEQLGIFELIEKSENEIIVGGDDKHLNLRVSLYLEPLTDEKSNRGLIITTCVKFNNLFGRIYFIPVKPIHQLIVKRTLKEIIRKLNSVRI